MKKACGRHCRWRRPSTSSSSSACTGARPRISFSAHRRPMGLGRRLYNPEHADGLRAASPLPTLQEPNGFTVSSGSVPRGDGAGEAGIRFLALRAKWRTRHTEREWDSGDPRSFYRRVAHVVGSFILDWSGDHSFVWSILLLTPLLLVMSPHSSRRRVWLGVRRGRCILCDLGGDDDCITELLARRGSLVFCAGSLLAERW